MHRQEPFYGLARLLIVTITLIALSSEPSLAGPWDNLKDAGDAAYQKGDYLKAEKCLREATIEAEKFKDTDKRRATTIYNLALVLQAQGSYVESEQIYLQALDLLGKSYGENSDRVTQVYNQLAELNKAQDALSKAEGYYLKALSLCEKMYGAESAALAPQLDKLAEFYAEQETYDQAEPLYIRALKLTKDTAGADQRALCIRQSHLADMYVQQGKYSQAEPLYASALKTADASLEIDDVETGKICYAYGSLFYDQNQYSQAEPLFRRALEIANKRAPGDMALIQANLAFDLDMQEKYGDAELIYSKCLTGLANHEDDAALMYCLKNYLKHFTLQKKKEEAAQIADRIKILKSGYKPKSVETQRPAP
jgi:tetratricopeptide (TPR) repeat protein